MVTLDVGQGNQSQTVLLPVTELSKTASVLCASMATLMMDQTKLVAGHSLTVAMIAGSKHRAQTQNIKAKP